MRFNRFDLNLLVALDAILTERNISRAAERLHLSQSTASHALARLREHFDDELLVQVGRQMELTRRAESLQAPVRDLLIRIGATVTLPKFDPEHSEREFVVYASDYSMDVLLPHVFALAERQRSRVRFKLLPLTSDAPRSLERGEVDLLVIPENFCSSEHPSETLLEEQFVAVLWEGSRLAQAELTLERYLAARHIAAQPPSAPHLAYDGWFLEQHGIRRSLAVTTYSMTSLPAMVVGTEMVATAHARIAEWMARALPLKVVPLPVALPPLHQAQQWHRHRNDDAAISWLRGLLKQAAQRVASATSPQGQNDELAPDPGAERVSLAHDS